MSQLTFLDKLMQERRAMTVSELTARVKLLLEREFADAWVEGEVSNFRRHSSGHWYFSLKDKTASLGCVCFRMQNRLVRFALHDGLSIRARGRLSVYDVRGHYQLVVEHLEPVGAGPLQLAFEQLKKKLEAEGLFNASRKRPLPRLPRSVGLVTSPTGAAVRDVLRVIRRRNETLSVLIAPARVQGEGSAVEIVRAIKMLDSRREVDVIIVARGGGSIEDLWSFNEETVARAIYKSRTPVISAVGHETDFTIADFVADLRASTPSAAAEMVASALDEITARVKELRSDLVGALRYRVLELRNQLSELEASRAFDAVSARIRQTAQQFDEAVYAMEFAVRQSMGSRRMVLGAVSLRLRDADMRRAIVRRRGRRDLLANSLLSNQRALLERSKERLSLAAGKLDSLSPLAVLGRGYAIAFDGQGRVIKRAADVSTGDQVRVRVNEGELDCTKN
jgi:exodeoxyribonuclease VII large subunit